MRILSFLALNTQNGFVVIFDPIGASSPLLISNQKYCLILLSLSITSKSNLVSLSSVSSVYSLIIFLNFTPRPFVNLLIVGAGVEPFLTLNLIFNPVDLPAVINIHSPLYTPGCLNVIAFCIPDVLSIAFVSFIGNVQFIL